MFSCQMKEGTQPNYNRAETDEMQTWWKSLNPMIVSLNPEIQPRSWVDELLETLSETCE